MNTKEVEYWQFEGSFGGLIQCRTEDGFGFGCGLMRDNEQWEQAQRWVDESCLDCISNGLTKDKDGYFETYPIVTRQRKIEEMPKWLYDAFIEARQRYDDIQTGKKQGPYCLHEVFLCEGGMM